MFANFLKVNLVLLLFNMKIGPCINVVKFLKIEFFKVLIVNLLRILKYFN